MSPMEPLPNGNGTTSPLQRIAIGLGTLIVVVLTVIAAVFLAMQDLPEEEATPVAPVSTTAIPSATPLPPISTSTPTSIPSPTDTPSTTPSPSATSLPPLEPTEVPATFTNTPEPSPPTATPTPVVVVVITPTPLPTVTQPEPVAGGVCQPPPTWITYAVQTGDTLNSLATRTNVSVFDLQQVNCLDSFTIQAGQTIYLPFTPPTPTVTNTPSPTGTRRPTPTRTPTPISPRILTVIVKQTDAEIIVIVKGENFRSKEAGFRAELVGPTTIPLQLGAARTSTSFEASAPIPDDLPPTLPRGAYDLVVINPSGRLDTKTGVYPPSNATPTTTPPPPEITRISPSSGRISEDVRLTVQGRNFRPLEAGFKVEIRAEDGSLTVELSVDEAVRPATSTSFDVIIRAGDLTRGTYDLLVTNPDGQTDIERSVYDAIE